MLSNIIKVWNAASTADMQEGMSWYVRAYEFCQLVADKYSLDVATVAGVVAALSPQNRWERNMRDAEAMVVAYKLQLEVPHCGTYAANVAKAQRILEGEEPLNVLGGNKVRSFYANIMGDSESVTVDGHAWCIANDNKQTMLNVPKLTDKVYHGLADEYRQAAKQVGVQPMQMQAVTWVTWRRLHHVSK